jgi:hypothetical protein
MTDTPRNKGMRKATIAAFADEFTKLASYSSPFGAMEKLHVLSFMKDYSSGGRSRGLKKNLQSFGQRRRRSLYFPLSGKSRHNRVRKGVTPVAPPKVRQTSGSFHA